MKEIGESKCPLCQNLVKTSFYSKGEREYFKCVNCDLIFLSPKQYLSANDEKSRYDLHQNDPKDDAYRNFLGKMFNPMQACIKEKSYGLDFGSGPNPTLSIMFEEAEHTMEIFDIYYANNPMVFKSEEYDFITLTEVIEHLHNPIEVLKKLWACLKPNGYLGIMTKFSTGIDDFPKWHYKNDDTHVCFFSENTFKWIAEKLNARIDYIKNDVVVYKKIDN